MFDYLAVRTVFFADFSRRQPPAASARRSSSGPDRMRAHAWRLRWPDATTLYEIDQVKVLKFKSGKIGGAGSTSRREAGQCRRGSAPRLAAGPAPGRS
jgi:hypothetical protein